MNNWTLILVIPSLWHELCYFIGIFQLFAICCLCVLIIDNGIISAVIVSLFELMLCVPQFTWLRYVLSVRVEQET